jgi:methylated-DNA-protein-cysteine methyltransferase-like protein
MRAIGKYRRIYDVVARIPKGRVATYGQVAALAGMPRNARLVGHAVRSLPADGALSLPWHRVVNAKGQVSPRGNGLGYEEDLQAHLLRREGVRVATNTIALPMYRWQPRVSPGTAGKKARVRAA